MAKRKTKAEADAVSTPTEPAGPGTSTDTTGSPPSLDGSEEALEVEYVEFDSDVEIFPGVYTSRVTKGSPVSRVYGPGFEAPAMYLVGDDIVFVDTGDRFPLPGIVRRYRLVP
jgi:hypothetical protein